MATDYISTKAADNLRLARSKSILTPSADTYNLINLPKHSFVKDVWLWVKVAGSSDTVSIGWTGNGETAQAAGFLSTDIANATVVGLKRAQHDTMVSFEGKYFFDAGGQLTMTVGTTQTTGEFHVLVNYTILH